MLKHMYMLHMKIKNEPIITNNNNNNVKERKYILFLQSLSQLMASLICTSHKPGSYLQHLLLSSVFNGSLGSVDSCLLRNFPNLYYILYLLLLLF